MLADHPKAFDRASRRCLNYRPGRAESHAKSGVVTRSHALRDSLPGGTVLRPEHLSLKKLGTGIPRIELEHVVEQWLQVAVPADGLLRESDLVPRR